ncbi:MAG: efflux transporter outer membrane subunit [Parvularculaceae bacterium]|nr:efflux transporter outer membrane subunit [Parvularculaceae bacterium]
MSPRLRFLLVSAASAALSACTLVPKERPEPGDLPSTWTQADASSDASPLPAASASAWWDAFADPTLKALTSEGLKENIPIRQAVLRVTQARANALQDISSYLPNFSADARAQYTRVVKGPQLVGSFTSFLNGGGGSIARENEQAFYSAGPSVSWEVPLFGLFPIAARGARVSNDIAAEDVRGATVALVGDIADAYVDLRAAQNRKLILAQSLANAERLAEVLESTVASGFTAPTDAADARRQTETTRARLPDADIAIVVAKSTIARLRGKAPGTENDSLKAALDAPGPVPTRAFDAKTAAPADLLRLRPDVARAERQAVLSALSVGAARHQLLPKLTISGNLGIADNLVGSPLPEQQGQLQITPLVSMPLFDFGSKLAAARSRKAQFRIDLLTYRDTVNGAVAEADRALVSLEGARKRLAAAAAAEQAAEKFAVGARAAQTAGLTSLRDRLQAEQLYLETQLARVEAEASLARASSSVYRAFAGALAPDGPVAARQAVLMTAPAATR